MLKELDISGRMVVADALNCQEKTARAVVDGKGDYLLSVKGNHAGLEADIEDYVQDDSLRKSMDTGTQKEKSRGRLETQELLHHARMEWAVESMHWLLAVHFGEDFCRMEDKAVQ